MKQPRLYLALDTPSLSTALTMARRVNDVEGDYGYKVNLDLLLLEGGIDVVRQLAQEFSRPIFTDTKTWNGGRTMAELVVGLARAGSSLINIYAQSGVKFMRRVVAAVEDNGVDIDVFGLGVLTHYTDEDCQRLYGRSLSETVRLFAEEVVKGRLSGYIQPGTCLRDTAGLPISRLIPAVRPHWFEDAHANSQEQTVTPAVAFENGADIVVCGSPVFESPDPAEALQRILVEIQAAS